MTIPSFSTKRLLLREVTLDDAPSYHKNFVDYEVIRTLSRLVPWPYPENGVHEFLQNVIVPNQGNDRWMWAICLKTDPAEVIGSIDLWREGRPEHRGFWLGRRYWNQGYMTEAVEPVTEYAFRELGFERLVFANAEGNVGSRRVKEKTGASLIEVVPGDFVDPKYTKREVWELTKETWLSQQAG